MENNLFAIATKEKYLYPYKGAISTEDLWDLTPNDLDKVFKNLNAQLKQFGEESLLHTYDCKEASVLNNKISIIKHILSVKLEEIHEREQAAANAAKRQRIMELIASKEDAALNELSTDELRKMLDELK